MHHDVDWMSKMIMMTANRVGGIKVMWDEEQVDQAQIKCLFCRCQLYYQTTANYNLSQKLTDLSFFMIKLDSKLALTSVFRSPPSGGLKYSHLDQKHEQIQKKVVNHVWFRCNCKLVIIWCYQAHLNLKKWRQPSLFISALKQLFDRGPQERDDSSFSRLKLARLTSATGRAKYFKAKG